MLKTSTAQAPAHYLLPVAFPRSLSPPESTKQLLTHQTARGILCSALLLAAVVTMYISYRLAIIIFQTSYKGARCSAETATKAMLKTFHHQSKHQSFKPSLMNKKIMVAVTASVLATASLFAAVKKLTASALFVKNINGVGACSLITAGTVPVAFTNVAGTNQATI
jgi:hypothetical protein